ncbi:hypothetical protein DSO57_1013893 [Entomophthora muscae]|uniref:Uncharacterized protein n=1 Tax=Entomophthora muscae TaxID=34485 RepID=A0ACC2TGK7_9FUNG|nr:hypothetical protein DSO57_1013893 [Entomophthora muscae]
MSEVLFHLLDVCVVVYLDNILKCKFFVTEIEFFGYKINLEAVLDLPRPTTCTKLCGFLGLRLSATALPLTHLTSKKVPFVWSPIAIWYLKPLKKQFTPWHPFFSVWILSTQLRPPLPRCLEYSVLLLPAWWTPWCGVLALGPCLVDPYPTLSSWHLSYPGHYPLSLQQHQTVFPLTSGILTLAQPWITPGLGKISLKMVCWEWGTSLDRSSSAEGVRWLQPYDGRKAGVEYMRDLFLDRSLRAGISLELAITEVVPSDDLVELCRLVSRPVEMNEKSQPKSEIENQGIYLKSQ